MRPRYLLALVLLAAVSACATDRSTDSGQSTAGSVWVADEGGDSLTVLDAGTDAVVTTLTGLAGPHNVQVGNDGAREFD